MNTWYAELVMNERRRDAEREAARRRMIGRTARRRSDVRAPALARLGRLLVALGRRLEAYDPATECDAAQISA